MVSQKSKANQKTTSELPLIPNKVYFPIGEVAKLCDLKPHVLRYWEQEFNQLKPTKRRGNRRYYQHKDVEMVREIRELLYLRGFTIEGARQQLSAKRGKSSTEIASDQVNTVPPKAHNIPIDSAIESLENLLHEIEV